MPTSITCHIFGRKQTFVRDFSYLSCRPSAVTRTLALIESRIDTIKKWGYHNTARNLKKQMQEAEHIPEERHRLLALTLYVMTSPFSELNKREAFLENLENGNSHPLNGAEILEASKEDIAMGLQKAVSIEDEKEKIVRSQLEAIFLHQEYGGNINGLHRYMLDRGIVIIHDFSGQNPDHGFRIVDDLEVRDTTHFIQYLINNEGPPSSLQSWHAVYMWRKPTNGAHYSPFSEDRLFEEVVIHSHLHTILDLTFLFTNRDKFALTIKESKEIYQRRLEVNEELEENIKEINREFETGLAIPRDLAVSP
jgi:hypothetical protein